jgi:4-amino-4-deoxy-L-arabinose transferase-like glycosyltransferase
MSVAVAPRRRSVWARVSGGAAEDDLRLVGVLTGLAFALRLVFVLTAKRHVAPFDDTFFYHTIATQLSTGHGYTGLDGLATAAWPPAYPFILAGLYKIFGSHMMVGEIFNVVISTLTVPLVYLLARDTLGKTEARFAAAVMAIMPSQIFWTDVELTESLAVFLTVGFLYWTVKASPRPRNYVITGALLALCALTRGENLFLLVIPVAIWWKQVDRRELLRRTAIVVVSAAVCVLPWTIRNVVSMHSFVPISTNFASTLWSGHNDKANGGPTYPNQKELNAELAGKKGPAKEIAQSKLLRDQALTWMKNHPGKELVLIPEKLISLVGPANQVFLFWINPTPQIIAVHHDAVKRYSIAADFVWYSLLAMTFTSIWVFGGALWRNRALLGSLAFILVSLVLYGFVFYGNFRYRAPLEPLMLLIAAPLAARVWRMRSRRSTDAAPPR